MRMSRGAWQPPLLQSRPAQRASASAARVGGAPSPARARRRRVPRYCESLFDGHESESFAANGAYMRRKHCFVVPEAAHLVDARGLFALLQARCCRGHIEKCADGAP